MTKKTNPIDDFQAAGRLTTDAIKGIVDVVQSVHQSILSLGGVLGDNNDGITSGITGMVYRNIRSATDLTGKGLDALATWLSPALAEKESSPLRESALSVLNGVLGDYLADSSSSLAIPMRWRRNGKSIDSSDQEFRQLVSKHQGKIILLIHGSCLNDMQWSRKGHDHGTAVSEDLGYLAVYVHYNSGRHISENGRELAQMLEELIHNIPETKEIIVLAHSMGGLVARSACYYGQKSAMAWLCRLSKMVFLGSPHHGAPLERMGNWIDNVLEKSAFSKPFSRLGKIRSAGVTDLRYGNVADEDWSGRDRFQASGDRRIAVPIPLGVNCYAIAGSIATSEKLANDFIGDGLVPVSSALGKHTDPKLHLRFDESKLWIAKGHGHLDLLSSEEVYNKIKESFI
ncbi:MAG: hypothetical protein HC819_23325 [Cyclobacteriaceae bacterium]|nr:hypothetical protein [Cyclobacteriaceae bacterium]